MKNQNDAMAQVQNKLLFLPIMCLPHVKKTVFFSQQHWYHPDTLETNGTGYNPEVLLQEQQNKDVEMCMQRAHGC